MGQDAAISCKGNHRENIIKHTVYFLQGEEKFTKKLIPYVFMSKDDFPESLSAEKVLLGIFQFIDEWKLKLFNMITSDTTREELQVR